MFGVRSYVVAFLLTLVVTVSAENCPQECAQCDCSEHPQGGIIIECRNWNETVMPGCLFGNVTELTMYGGAIVNLSGESFANTSELGQLTLLAITDSPLEVISSDAFQGMSALKTLRLANNALKELQDGCFAPLVSLEELDLQNNAIKMIEDLPQSLRALDLAHNEITDINIFALGALQLQDLILSYNKLTLIDSQHVKINTLEHLRLDHNEIEGIAYDGIPCQNLKILDLTDNALANLDDDILSSCHLMRLDLSNNHFERLEKLLANAGSIELLRLDGNPIEQIGADELDIEGLTDLYLSHTPLYGLDDKVFGSKPLETLLVIQITNNTQLDIHEALSPGMPLLRELYIDHNNIAALREDWFMNKYNLQIAEVGFNPILCSCQAAWIRDKMDDDTLTWIQPWRRKDTAIKCGAPSNMMGLFIIDVQRNDLTCEPPRVVNKKELVDDDYVVLQATWETGLPFTSWMLPDGSKIEPHRKIDGYWSAEAAHVAKETRLADSTVTAELRINRHLTNPMGSYTHTAVNAGGSKVLYYDVSVPEQPGGLGGGSIAAIVISMLLVFGIFIALFIVWYWRLVKNRYSRIIEDGTGEPPQDSTAEATSIQSDSRRPRSYGGLMSEETPQNPFETT